MKNCTEWNELSESEFAKSVEFRLYNRFGLRLKSIHAERFVQAARTAGFSPYECYCSIVRLDGLS